LLSQDTLIGELLRCHPEVSDVFRLLGMNCSRCYGISQETIATAARMHEIPVEVLLHELEKAIAQ